ncbi:MAG: restriction endonuclease [Candidatus Peribacteraceae bacterium]|nr:restriction endonuclease [Candidatus Peribacteraceae bacterium]
MSTYNFGRLSPTDFEKLMKDLIEKELEISLEIFTNGPDEGIDLRCSHPKNKNGTIIQCKHYKETNDLMKNLKLEAEKVKKLKPDRYIVATSAGLTPDNKDEIMKIFKPFIKCTADIYGITEIESLLSSNPEILKQHFKLWLADTAILQKILHSGIEVFSEFSRDKINRDLSLYVQNESFKVANELLEINGYCIISGEPGIGKTTLAHMLIYNYLNDGYELIYVSKDIEEAATKFDNSDKKQIFYYDDFLGANFLEQFLEKNEDSRISIFIEKIAKSKNKKLIFTTREYILNQAKIKYEKIERSNVDFSKCVIDLESYTKVQKAQILYNHLYHSDLSQEVKDSICKKKYYHKIIEHRNYSPRIIEDLSRLNEIDDVDVFIAECLRHLNDPQIVWKSAFDLKITESSRNLLYVLYGLQKQCKLDQLKEAWMKFHSHQCKKYNNSMQANDFDLSIKELQKSFIVLDVHNVGGKYVHLVRFINPSVVDFLLARIKNNEVLIEDMLNNCIFWEQIIYFLNLSRQNKYVEIAMDKFDLPSVHRNKDAEKLLSLSRHIDVEGVMAFIQEKAEYLVGQGDVSISLINLIIECPEIDVDYEYVIKELADGIRDYDELKHVMEGIDLPALEAFLKENEASAYELISRAEEIANEICSDGMNTGYIDEDEIFHGDLGELDKCIAEIGEIDSYFGLQTDISDLEKLRKRFPSESDDIEHEYLDRGSPWQRIQEESKEVDRIFGAGF